jgi:hypothetical protein
MTTFATHAQNYLRLRRSFGFKLGEHGRLLPRFAGHLDAIGAESLSVELAVAWATEPVVGADSRVPALRLLIVRGFARYLAGIVPPTGLIRCVKRRRAPYIYTEQEILTLMARAHSAIRQRLAAATKQHQRRETHAYSRPLPVHRAAVRDSAGAMRTRCVTVPMPRIRGGLVAAVAQGGSRLSGRIRGALRSTLRPFHD